LALLALPVAVVGLLDDLRPLSWRLRLAVQALAATAALPIAAPQLSPWLWPLAGLWGAGLTHALNMLDHIGAPSGGRAAPPAAGPGAGAGGAGLSGAGGGAAGLPAVQPPAGPHLPGRRRQHVPGLLPRRRRPAAAAADGGRAAVAMAGPALPVRHALL